MRNDGCQVMENEAEEKGVVRRIMSQKDKKLVFKAPTSRPSSSTRNVR